MIQHRSQAAGRLRRPVVPVELVSGAEHGVSSARLQRIGTRAPRATACRSIDLCQLPPLPLRQRVERILPKGPLMKWRNVVVLCLDGDDESIRTLTANMFGRYYIDQDLDDNEVRCFGGTGQSKPQTGCLRGLSDLHTKVVICGHGNEYMVDTYYPRNLAAYLLQLGLSEVGLLSFKSCEVGKGAYLDELAGELHHLGVQVGWLVGYKDLAFNRGYSMAVGKFENNLRYYTRDMVTKLPDSWRVKVVRGNTAVTPPKGTSSRYPKLPATGVSS
jgi:hypothetical protein